MFVSHSYEICNKVTNLSLYTDVVLSAVGMNSRLVTLKCSIINDKTLRNGDMFIRECACDVCFCMICVNYEVENKSILQLDTYFEGEKEENFLSFIKYIIILNEVE